MKKILKFLLPVSTIVAGFTPLMVSCGGNNPGGNYDLNWTYVSTDQKSHMFVPSTPEEDLPTEEKTWQDATRLYANAIKTKNVLMTDDFFTSWNEYAIGYASMGNKGSYAYGHLTFVDASLDNSVKYPSPMILMSFNFKIEIYVTGEQEGQPIEMKQIWQGELTKYPFFANYAGQTPECWAIKPNIEISDELLADTDWKVHYYGYMSVTGGATVEYNATVDHTIGEASKEKQDEFTTAVAEATFKSYYFSKMGYIPPEP
ncbi:MAG: hypothetical protein ACOQNV_02385 [Mycoplasmoidaceae bacterium]